MKEFINKFIGKGLTWKHWAIAAWMCINFIFLTGITEDTPFLAILVVLVSLGANVYVSNRVPLPEDFEE